MTEKRFWILNVLTKNSGIKDRDKLLSFDEVVDLLNEQHEEITYLEKKKCDYWNKYNQAYLDSINFKKENEQLKSENKRLTDKLNKTALELVDECISQGKATEISEMSYHEFIHYRAKNGKPMELQL